MFGMGFFEILMIGVVAIIFLGPEKLPKALVDMAKFFKAVKKTMDDAKESIEREVNLSKIKEEALAYKNSLTQGVQTLSKDLELKELNLDFNDDLQSSKTTQNQIPITQDSNPPKILTTPQDSNSSREIKPKESHKTTLSFGANLPQEESTKNTESDSTSNKE